MKNLQPSNPVQCRGCWVTFDTCQFPNEWMNSGEVFACPFGNQLHCQTIVQNLTARGSGAVYRPLKKWALPLAISLHSATLCHLRRVGGYDETRTDKNRWRKIWLSVIMVLLTLTDYQMKLSQMGNNCRLLPGVRGPLGSVVTTQMLSGMDTDLTICLLCPF